ncbi:MAG: MutS protein msh4 [Chrysothrix sp. TS-e1954]|nr:MAG: MutS protein msh4 [Chrysothrix sp. TS-e1954]
MAPDGSNFASLQATTSASATGTGRRSTARPRTGRPKTGRSTIAGIEGQTIICAINESRGVSPTVGIAFVNIDTCETVLCQICDTQTYVRTVQKVHIFGPSNILVVSTAAEPKSKLLSVIEELTYDLDAVVTLLDRRYWAENTGREYIHQLSPRQDVDALKTAISGNYFAVCSLAAALKYIEHNLSLSFPLHSLRIKYEASEGTMLIDISTIRQLELIQNLNDGRSKDCLFGLLNQTLTPMGARLLRSNILQPMTQIETLTVRYDALEELATKEEMFFGVRHGLSSSIDADRLLTSLILIPAKEGPSTVEQSVNNVIMLREFLASLRPIFEALTGARSRLLLEIRDLCAPRQVNVVADLIDSCINEDTKYSKSPLDLRHQRTFASGVNGLLDVARTIYKENSDNVVEYTRQLGEDLHLDLDLKFDNVRQYYIRTHKSQASYETLPSVFINVVRKRDFVECSTLDLLKKNQKILDSHQECLNMSDEVIQSLINTVREHVPKLFKVCEAVAMLDMTASFAHLVTTQDYVRPVITSTLGIKAGRHPIKERLQAVKYVPNDVLAALFQPMDNGSEANMSTFATEMQEMAFILSNVNSKSMVIIDELGRGTSTRDGLAIAIAVAEALVNSGAHVWFVTHFIDLAGVMGERSGVSNHHLVSEDPDTHTITPLYRVTDGPLQESSYGLKLAALLPLPQAVLTCAQDVSNTLNQQRDRQRSRTTPVLLQRRRRLILDLHEHLRQAQEGNMAGPAMQEWLEALRKEFVIRMTRI